MLCLSERDLLKAVTPLEMIDAVKQAMQLSATGNCLMPDRMHLDFNGNTLLLMPSAAVGRFGTKLVSVFPGNREKKLPVVIGTMVLNNGETGEPLAILNGTALTAMRTGAVGAAGIDYLTPGTLKTAGVIGAGMQGYNQALFATHVRRLSDVYIFDHDKTQAHLVREKLSRQRPGVSFHCSGSVEDLLQQSEAIITATTSMEPVLPDDQTLLKGKHFIGIGSFRPNMREFPEALFRLVDHVYVDTEHAKQECGDLVIPLKNGWINESQVSLPGKPCTSATTIFKSVGMALFDLVTSDLIYRSAISKGLGTDIAL